MTEASKTTDANRVLTVEEIANFAKEGGKPAATLMNVVALIARRFRTDVCSAYLLEPDRSNLVLAATLGLHPKSIGTLRMPLHEGLTGLVAEQVLPVAVADARKHPRFKYFKESGEEEYHSFLGVPLIHRGILQGVLVVQTKEPRVFREDEIRMLVETAGQVAPVISEARTLDRFIAPVQERLWALARNVWWSWDHDCISLFRDLNPGLLAGAQPESHLAAQRDAAGGDRAARGGTGSARPHQLRLPSPAGVSACRPHLGSSQRGRAAAAPGGLFFRRVRLARIAAHLFRGPGRAGRRPHQERVGPGYSAGRRRFVLRAGILSAAAGRKRVAAGGVSGDRCQPIADAAGDREKRRAGGGGNSNSRRSDPRQGVAGEGGPLRPAAARLECGRQRAGGSGNYFTAVWRRRAHAHPPGAAAGHRRLSRAEGDGHLSGGSAPERRAQRLRRL